MTGGGLVAAISPFLLVDRQVQEMASKVARLGSHNLLTSDDPPKDVVLKSPVAGTMGSSAEHYLNIVLNESTTDDLDNVTVSRCFLTRIFHPLCEQLGFVRDYVVLCREESTVLGWLGWCGWLGWREI